MLAGGEGGAHLRFAGGRGGGGCDEDRRLGDSMRRAWYLGVTCETGNWCDKIKRTHCCGTASEEPIEMRDMGAPALVFESCWKRPEEGGVGDRLMETSSSWHLECETS